jgi:ferredoxin
MRVIVDQDRCCGAGQCVLSVPSVFDQDERTGIVVLLTEVPPADLDPDVLAAVDLCPGQAIRAEASAETPDQRGAIP